MSTDSEKIDLNLTMGDGEMAKTIITKLDVYLAGNNIIRLLWISYIALLRGYLMINQERMYIVLNCNKTEFVYPLLLFSLLK